MLTTNVQLTLTTLKVRQVTPPVQGYLKFQDYMVHPIDRPVRSGCHQSPRMLEYP